MEILTTLTPASFCIAFTYVVVLVLLFLIALNHRDAVGKWFLARASEPSSQHAMNTALTTTALWLGGGVTFATVLPLWAGCIGVFIKPDKSPS